MRILYTYKDYYPILGGIENHIKQVAEGMRQRGSDTSVLVTNTGKQTVTEAIDGIPVVKSGRQLNVSSAPVSFGFFPQLHRLSKDVDIVHAHAPYPPGELAQLLAGRSKRFVISYHSDIVRQRVLGAIYAPLLRIVLRSAKLIAAATPVYVDDSPFLRAEKSKCRIIPYGTDLKRLQRSSGVEENAIALRQRFANKPLLLFVGRLRHYKGVNVLIDAMRNIPDAHALIIGIGPLEQELKAQAAGLQDRITFLGEANDEEALIARYAADIFVFPSTNRAETFGIAQIEAMACGLPVICTELGTGTSWVNQNEKTGLVIPPNDANALTLAIRCLLDNPDLRHSFGKAARERAQQEFSQEAMLDKLQAFYEEALR